MRNRLLLVGEAPSRTGRAEPKYALTGSVGKRIAEMAGLSMNAYLRRSERVNVFDRWPGSNGKGSEFPRIEAKLRASRLAKTFYGRTVLFVGIRVAEAFGYASAPILAKHEFVGSRGWIYPPFQFAVVPHPSRVNRWYNSKRNVGRASAFLRKLFAEFA